METEMIKCINLEQEDTRIDFKELAVDLLEQAGQVSNPEHGNWVGDKHDKLPVHVSLQTRFSLVRIVEDGHLVCVEGGRQIQPKGKQGQASMQRKGGVGGMEE